VIERLRADHEPALLAFELANRPYFAASIPDRGDEYFTHFRDRFASLLEEQKAGACHFHVVVSDGEILGRVNLVDVADGSADLGFRITEKAAGRGLATASVREVVGLANGVYGLTRLRAAAAVRNVGSRTVLLRNGFTPTGEEVQLSGKPGLWYELRLPEAGCRTTPEAGTQHRFTVPSPDR
jgi:ribosomal-protein-alanine N-acetyltransferase